MDRVLHTSEYPPKASVTLCQIKISQRHDVKKFKFKILSLGVVIHVLCHIFVKNATNDRRTPIGNQLGQKLKI